MSYFSARIQAPYFNLFYKDGKGRAKIETHRVAIWDRCKLEGHGVPVTLPNAFALDPWGVDRHAKGRALRILERAGLIAVERSTGRAPRIVLLDPRSKGKEPS